MPTTWTPASSRLSCSAIAPRSWACAMSWPTSARSTWPRMATSRSIVTEQAGEIEGDLFVDCTGFRSLLLGKALGVRFKDCSDVLFCDTALAMQVPYEHADAARSPSHTISTAQSAGWIWDIGLPTRRGVGYVYSSRHNRRRGASANCAPISGPRPKICRRARSRSAAASRDLLEEQLRRGRPRRRLPGAARILGHRAGRTVGQADRRADARQPRGDGHRRRALQRRRRIYRWGRIIDFLKLHYVLTQAATTPPSGATMLIPQPMPDRLQDLLQLWKYQPPWFHDEFDRLEEVFPAASYQYVLYGMGFRTEVEPEAIAGGAKLARARDARERGADRAAARRIAAPPRSDPQDRRIRSAAGLTGALPDRALSATARSGPRPGGVSSGRSCCRHVGSSGLNRDARLSAAICAAPGASGEPMPSKHQRHWRAFRRPARACRSAGGVIDQRWTGSGGASRESVGRSAAGRRRIEPLGRKCVGRLRAP